VNLPTGLTVDITNNELFVVNDPPSGPFITVHNRTAGGNATPLRTLGGAATGLNDPGGITLDLTHDELFVANGLGNSVTVYARTANGNATPLRTLSGAATGLDVPRGLALDLIHDELFVVNNLPPQSPSITVYSRTASGNTAPLRTLVGATTGLGQPVALALDLASDELFVLNQLSKTITVYSRTASGNIAPIRTLIVGLHDMAGLALDPTNDELFVSNAIASGASVNVVPEIAIYSRTANGSASPLRVLVGPATGLNDPYLGLAVAVGGGPPPPCPGTSLVSAVLPSSRSVQVGTTATVFATTLNAGPNNACAASIALASPIPAAFKSNQTDCSTNAVIGPDNATVNISTGGSACFVLSVTPSAPFLPTEVTFTVAASNAPAVATLVGINTLLLSASSSPVPDIVALAATLSNDGIVHIPGPNGAAPFAVATVNVGASALITASTNTGSAVLPLAIFICQTSPAGGCMAPPASSVAVQINAGDQPTFGIFVNAGGAIPLDPANNRIFVVFTDTGGVVRGRTSVAVETQ
jgi:hypothetical protein